MVYSLEGSTKGVMKIFITGATGFLGGTILKRLAGQHEFYGMARSPEAAVKLKALGAIPVICELGSVEPRHLHDCDTIIHAAAFTKEWGTREEFWQPTVYGTQQLVEAAKKSSVKRFIQISTEAVLFTGDDLNDIDESYPYPSRSKFLYSESKLEAEKLALTAHEPGKFEVSVIRPRLIWGAGDQAVLPVLVKMVKDNKFRWINNGTNLTSTTHVFNVVEGIRCLLENWKPGEVFFITDGEISTYKKFLTAYMATQGIVPPDKSISKPMARFTANLVEWIWRTFRLRSTPPITRLPAYMLSANFTISHKKAEREIHYKPVISVAEGMKQVESAKS
jgi:nucleoside-diphosphate-sugar epimerase